MIPTVVALLMALNMWSGTFNVSTGTVGTTWSVTGLGFTPKVILFYWNGRTATGTVSAASHQQGVGYAVSTSDRGNVTSQSLNGNTNMGADSMVSDDSCIKVLVNTLTSPPGLAGAADLQSMDADGFTLKVTTQFSAGILVGYLALGGSDVTNVASQTVTGPATATTQNVTGYGFQPDVVFFFVCSNNAVNTSSTSSRFGFGVATAATQYILSGSSFDNVGTSVTCTYCRAGECIAEAVNNATIAQASCTGFGSDGFSLSWSKVGSSGSVVRALAIKGPSFFAGDFMTSTTVNAQIPETGFGFAPVSVLVASHNHTSASSAGTTQATDQRSVGSASSNSGRNVFSVLDANAAAVGAVSTGAATFGVYQNAQGSGAVDMQTWDSNGLTFYQRNSDNFANFAWFLAVGPAPPPAAVSYPGWEAFGPAVKFDPPDVLPY